MTVKVPTIKFTVACSDCNEDVELEFLPNGILHAVDDRDYYAPKVDSFNGAITALFSTDCGHDYYWSYPDTELEPMFNMLVAKFNWEPNDTVFGYLMPGRDGLIEKVVTL